MKWVILITLLAFNVYAKDPHHDHNGQDGQDGQDGIDGQDGVDGQDGTNGIDGTNGTNGTNGVDGVSGLSGGDTDDNWSDDDFKEAYAASSAMAGIDFDSTTSKLQLGIAVGGYGNEEQVAVGVGKVLDNKKFGDILLSFKTTLDDSGRDNDRPWVGSAVWKVKIE